MSFPLEAFKYASVSMAKPGTIAADDKGSWFLIARKTGATDNQMVRLSRGGDGAEIGGLISSVAGRVLMVAEPYTTSVRVDDIFDLRRGQDGPLLGAILLAEPLAILTVDADRHLIGLDGYESDERTVHRQRARYMKWSVWLIDRHGRPVGNQPLVQVDAANR